ncbi:MAG TPA: phosphoribosyltransferase family protein [Candidatus Acidoferrales bacterium]|nr:phosphoribosyltransferase family protein [Candidatus Acidoferrales bacterium]
MPALPFYDRRAAGVTLARALFPRDRCVVLGIARGGVVVAAAVGAALAAPLDVIVVRKVGHPMQPELAIGAVSVDGDAVTTEHAAGLPRSLVPALFATAREKAVALDQRLRGDLPSIQLEGRPAIIVDDGIATAATMLCAIETVRKRKASFITVAVPVAPADCAFALRSHCDELVVLVASRDLPFAVGRFYFSFAEVSDDRVREELDRARARGAA